MRVFLIVAGLLAALLSPARAERIDIVDRSGRAVSVQLPVKRFVIGEGRYIPLLALLRPENPVAGLVGTMSPLSHTEPALEAQLFERFPAARDIALFGSNSADSVSVEKIIDLQPQLAIFGLNDHGPGAKNAELLRQLEAAGIAVVFIDFRLDPMTNTLPSIDLLGRLLGAENRAADYAAFYRGRLETIRERVAQAKTRPSVFVQAHPGRFDCCWGMAEGMLGPFVGLAGGHNIADAVAPGPTAQHTAEFLLTENPDVWIGTASGTPAEYRAGGKPVALGAGISTQDAAASLKRYLSAPEFQAMDAVRGGRAHSVWHNFYNSPFNIVALEAFAVWIHPDLFADLDPQRTLAHIYDTYLPFTLEGTYFATVLRD
ncbi:MAG: ABC transporter substrate-binding protein [Alphaproteobacteria bacterium]|nr:ABC transporter substrate-binding protein [Alphaproteobacteria bacterium]MBU1812465.1 ABC transporter substrate-binding protein [Alphaproteobacteria bacterium]